MGERCFKPIQQEVKKLGIMMKKNDLFRDIDAFENDLALDI